jgi:hypothetical protein
LRADGAGLHDWHAAWIEELVTTHEGAADESRQGDRAGPD